MGPLLFVPSIDRDRVNNLEVFSPHNGHTMGATFVPGVIYSDAELDDPEPERWPGIESFTLLDPHSYLIDVRQTKAAKRKEFLAEAIPDTNHKIRAGRRLSHDWNVALGVHGQLSEWTSHRLLDNRGGGYIGSDAPTKGTAACTHRLTYRGVTGVEFLGASSEAKQYLDANISKGGTLVIVGEIPYQPSLVHERAAIASLAKLAGLDLHLASVTPQASRVRGTGHLFPCAFSIVLV